jgi:hypothetical protein
MEVAHEKFRGSEKKLGVWEILSIVGKSGKNVGEKITYNTCRCWQSSTLDEADSTLLAANIEFSEKTDCWDSWEVLCLQNVLYQDCMSDIDIEVMNVEYLIMLNQI